MNTNRIKTVEELLKTGLADETMLKKLLRMPDIMPKSIVVDTGTYCLYWLQNSIIVSKHNELPDKYRGMNNWVTIHDKGYFAGTDMNNVTFHSLDNTMKNLSQEEIDALIEEMHKEQSQVGQMELDFKYNPNGPKNYGYVNQDAPKKECDHIWKSYHGLNESFDYCEKCDVKK